jgi:predicted Rossmann fold nucleotide-binding protein DprA/Smf involved in DNA uptake
MMTPTEIRNATAQELIDEIRRTQMKMGGITSAVMDLLTALSRKTDQLQNQKDHFQRKHLEIWGFLDDHYPEACRDFDIVQNGGELE